MQFTAQLPVIGLDLAKSVFQLHIVDMDSGEIQRRQIKRAKLTDFFAKCQKSLVAMECVLKDGKQASCKQLLYAKHVKRQIAVAVVVVIKEALLLLVIL
jgi:hypothetical protein